MECTHDQTSKQGLYQRKRSDKELITYTRYVPVKSSDERWNMISLMSFEHESYSWVWNLLYFLKKVFRTALKEWVPVVVQCQNNIFFVPFKISIPKFSTSKIFLKYKISCSYFCVDLWLYLFLILFAFSPPPHHLSLSLPLSVPLPAVGISFNSPSFCFFFFLFLPDFSHSPFLFLSLCSLVSVRFRCDHPYLHNNSQC